MATIASPVYDAVLYSASLTVETHLISFPQTSVIHEHKTHSQKIIVKHLTIFPNRFAQIFPLSK